MEWERLRISRGAPWDFPQDMVSFRLFWHKRDKISLGNLGAEWVCNHFVTLLPFCYKEKLSLYKFEKISYSNVRTHPACCARRRYRNGMPQYVCRTRSGRDGFKKF